MAANVGGLIGGPGCPNICVVTVLYLYKYEGLEREA